MGTMQRSHTSAACHLAIISSRSGSKILTNSSNRSGNMVVIEGGLVQVTRSRPGLVTNDRNDIVTIPWQWRLWHTAVEWNDHGLRDQTRWPQTGAGCGCCFYLWCTNQTSNNIFGWPDNCSLWRCSCLYYSRYLEALSMSFSLTTGFIITVWQHLSLTFSKNPYTWHCYSGY